MRKMFKTMFNFKLLSLLTNSVNKHKANTTNTCDVDNERVKEIHVDLNVFVLQNIM